MTGIYLLVFLGSCLLLIFASSQLVKSLANIAVYLGWREFILSFFLMAFGVSIPNLFIGIISALNKVPELSFGDVLGGNIFDMSIAIGIAVLFSSSGITSESRTVQKSSIFTIIVAILPIVLIFDLNLSRIDGIILMLAYFLYAGWLFSNKERFTRPYEVGDQKVDLKIFLKDVGFILFGIILLLLGAKGIVESSMYFSEIFNIPIGIIGVLVVGVGNSMPELFFAIHASKSKDGNWMVLGDLMGGVVVTSTFILGLVALIHPIQISGFSAYFMARLFLVISAIFFFIAIKTERKITKKEGIFLIALYVVFVIAEIINSI